MSESGVAERLEQVEALAIEVFGSRATALAWLASPNVALDGRTPHSLCATILGAPSASVVALHRIRRRFIS